MKWTKSRLHLIVAAVMCIASAAVIPACASNSGSGMTESTLEQDMNFELREGQSGFAGVSGTILRIAADGTVTISTFLNERESPPSHTGKLDATRQRELISQFRSAHFEELPESLGSVPPVNPRTLSLKFGAKTVVLSFPPTNPEQSLPIAENAQARQVIDLATKLREAAEQIFR